jgi:hypothetical protein
MKPFVDFLGDLLQLSNPLKSTDLTGLAISLARWVFLLILALTVTGVLLALAAG